MRSQTNKLAIMVLFGLLSLTSAEQQNEDTEADARSYLENRLKMKQVHLDLTRVQMEKARAKRELDQATMLFEAGIVSQKQVNEAQKNFEELTVLVEQRELDVEQIKADILNEASSVSVIEAKKYRTQDGERMVVLVLVNDSLVGRMKATFSDLDHDKIADLMTIRDIRISLKDESIIGKPYEAGIPRLLYSEKATLTFQLLKDLDEVNVDIRFGQTHIVLKVYLQKESLEAFPSIDSAQFSQEGSLGGKVRFDILLEKLSEKDESFRLAVINLPKQIDSSFVDAETNAKVMQVKFTEETPKRQLYLELSVPEKLDSSLVDQTIAFHVIVTGTKEFRKINELMERFGRDPIEESEIYNIEGNKVRLELIPRGVGEIEIVSGNRYQEIRLGEKPIIRVDVRNSGTATVINTRVIIDAPYQWKEEISPTLVPEIKPGDKEPVVVWLTPSASTGVGEYDVRVRAEAEVGTEKIEATEKNMAIRIASKGNVLGNVILIGILMALVIGIAVASIRISRR